MTPLRLLVRLAPLCVLLAGCSFNSSANHAHGCGQCPAGQCYLGYCLSPSGINGFGDAQVPGFDAKIGTGESTGGSISVPSGSGGTGAPGTGGGGVIEGGVPNGPCVAGGACYQGPAGTRGIGSCKDGVATCTGSVLVECTGQVMPTPEACNAIDDDCDGESDEDIVLGSCSLPTDGACATGRLQCQAGRPICAPSSAPLVEVCNGIDDDCDGKTDEQTEVVCYPANTLGCTQGSDGAFTCKGQCKPGKQVCTNGTLQACADAVVPAKEKCGGDQAIDEDCDGKIDNGCPCTGTQTQICYSGAFLSFLNAPCQLGTQRCVNGTFGDCEGEVTPRAETCANPRVDDDCNGTVDDVPTIGKACPGRDPQGRPLQGVCADGTWACRNGQRVCATPAPKPSETKCDGLDENCDGQTDETFDLTTDEANCGSCGHACTAGQLCCASACRTVAQDPQYCGSCGQACVGGTACCNGVCCGAGQSCCNGTCVTTGTTSNCASCGDQCQAGQDCCNRLCTPLGTRDHCGSCAEHCGTDQGCCGGSCKSTGASGAAAGCGDTQTCCGEGCVTSGTNDHCTACIACAANQTCCGASCFDLKNTLAHCGRCDLACTGATCTACMNGMCVDAMGMPCQ